MANDSFTKWFNAQGFRHFGAREFTRYFDAERRGVKNSTPPKKLWKNVVPTLRVVDDLSRGRIDVTVGSALDLFGGSGVRYEELLAWNSGEGR